MGTARNLAASCRRTDSSGSGEWGKGAASDVPRAAGGSGVARTIAESPAWLGFQRSWCQERTVKVTRNPTQASAAGMIAWPSDRADRAETRRAGDFLAAPRIASSLRLVHDKILAIAFVTAL
jgi:hypothetical protein